MAAALPNTYKAAVFKKADEKLTIEDVKLKEPEQGHVLIKVLANGICHTDAMVQSGAMGSPLWVDLASGKCSLCSCALRKKLTIHGV